MKEWDVTQVEGLERVRKVLFLSTSTNNVFTFIESAREAWGEAGEIGVFHYDRRWNEACAQAVAANPGVRGELQAGTFRLPPERVRLDREMLAAVEEFAPDLVLYISAWEGAFVPANETLAAINAKVPLVHFCCDASDPPWWPQMAGFARDRCFTTTVNIDGGKVWPGGECWAGALGVGAVRGLTLLTPVQQRWFGPSPLRFADRPFAVAYAGNAGGWIRSKLVRRLSAEPWFEARGRDDHPLSYPAFCEFLRYARIVVDVPFSGSNATKQVKGRILEAAFAGAGIMTWRDGAVRDWFVPREMFEEYGSIEEAVEVGAWLSGQPRRCEEMAWALAQEVRREHAPAVFWRKVVAEVEDARAAADEPTSALEAAS